MSWPVAYRGAASAARALASPQGLSMAAVADTALEVTAAGIALARAAPIAAIAAEAAPLIGILALGFFAGYAIASWVLPKQGWDMTGFHLYCDSGENGADMLGGRNYPEACLAGKYYADAAAWSGIAALAGSSMYVAEFKYRDSLVGLDGREVTRSWVRDTAVGEPPLVVTPPIYAYLPTDDRWVAGVMPPVVGPRPRTPVLPEMQPDWTGTEERPWNTVLNWTAGGSYVSTRPNVRTIPRYYETETKLRMNPGLAKVIALYNESTEYCDFIGSLFAGLKKSQRAMAGGPKASCMQQQAAVAEHAADIDWNVAIKEFLWKNFTDEIWAKLGLPTKEAGLSYGHNAPINTALGQVSADQVRRGLKGWKEAFDAALADVSLSSLENAWKYSVAPQMAH